jgi:phosphoribosylformimino-5-aminoimidazole carboxamide ribotide isomerase
VVASQSSSFELYPAIDLRGGRVVRLEQGRFDRELDFGADPASVAAGFVAAGARWLHVVDLDGAKSGERAQAPVVESVIRSAESAGSDGRCRIQVAGGLRDERSVAAVLTAGASRAVLGTAALRNDGFLAAQVAKHGPARIAVALDIRDGEAVGHGWVAGAAGVPWRGALASLEAAGVRTVVVTAIARDGLLGGPDLALLRDVIEATDAAVIASGGIRSADDLAAVRDAGCAGAIVGRALYDGTLDLRAALAAMEARR